MRTVSSESKVSRVAVSKTVFVLSALVLFWGVHRTVPAATFKVSDVAGLRSAITEANANREADTIHLSTGTYKVSDIEGGPLPFITSDISIEGKGAASTIIQRDTKSCPFRLFTVQEGSLTLKFVTVRKGNVAGTDVNGGGIWCDGVLTIMHSVISDNTSADSDGGGIYLAHGTCTILGSFIEQNSAGSSGGGVYAVGDLFITDSMISDNTANDAGGGIVTAGMHTAHILHSTISGNISAYGGGIYNLSYLSLTNSTVSGNTAASTHGGGIADSVGCVILNSTISGNHAKSDGGGMDTSYESQVDVVNSTFSGNSAGDDGGGIAIHWDGATVRLYHATIAGNTADSDADDDGDGGGIHFNDLGAVYLHNSIVAHNSDTGGEAPDCFGTFVSQDYNLIQDVSGATIGGATTHNITGSDPLLEPLADNGAFTQTRALGAGSPALDTADPASCLSSDQRGLLRPGGSNCDIGAFEADSTQYVPQNGIWRDPNGLFNLYVQKYHTGSAVVIATLDGRYYEAFLDTDFSDGISVSDDVGSQGYSLSWTLTSGFEGSVQIDLPTGATSYSVSLAYPSFSDPQGVGQNGISRDAGGILNVYFQEYLTGSCVTVVTTDGLDYVAFLDPDYTEEFFVDNDVGSQGYTLAWDFTAPAPQDIVVDLPSGSMTQSISLVYPELQ